MFEGACPIIGILEKGAQILSSHSFEQSGCLLLYSVSYLIFTQRSSSKYIDKLDSTLNPFYKSLIKK